MRSWSYWLRHQVACGLVILLAAPFADGATTAPLPGQATSSQQTGAPAAPAGQSQAPAPDNTAPAVPAPDAAQNPVPSTGVTPPVSPSTTAPATQDSTPAAGQEQAPQATPAQTPEPAQQPAAPPKRPADTAPVGTAAAPYEKGVGNAASRPAGAAIAPAKQKRTRSILIRVGILVGAAAAIGTVVGLSMASPSRPN